MPHPQLAVASSSWVKLECSASPVRGTRVLDGVLSPRPTPTIPATVCGCCCARIHCPTDDNTLPRRATGPAATQDSGTRTRATTRRGRSHHNLVSELDGDCRRSRTRDEEIRISILETSDVGFVERIAAKRKSDFTSDE